MSWRIVSVSSLAKLDYKMDYLVVRTQDSVRRVHLSEISVLQIESTAVSLTAYLLCELAKWKIDVVFCDEKRFPYGMLLPLQGSHDTSLHYKTQAAWSKEIKDLVWAEIIRAKIRGQLSVLPKEREAERKLIFSYLPQVEKDNNIVVSQFTLKEIVRQTIFTISDNDNNKLMTGELFDISSDQLKVVSLDGHRISIG